MRTALNEAGQVSRSQNCGVRVVQGQHRAYVTDFIRDARAGGCAAGVPPSNLGFRLVVERERWPRLQHLVSAAKSTPHRRLLAQQRLAPSHPLDRELDGRAVEATILQALFEMIGNARHLLLLIEQIVADAEHVHAGLERGKAG